MKGKMFKNLSESEKIARLLSVIVNKTNGKLNKEQLENVVTQIDPNIQYTIKVIGLAKDFAKEITLNKIEEYGSYNNEPSFMGGTTENAKVIIGENIQLGKHFKEDWDNTEEVREPNFDIENIYVVTKTIARDYVPLVNAEEWNENWTKYELIIYIPDENPYVVDEKVKYILDNFNIV